MTRKYGLTIATLLLLAPQLAFTAQSVSSIVATATLFAEKRALQQGYDDVRVNVRPVDSRINLTACDVPLSASSSGERVLGPVSVAVKCAGPAPWTVHVRATVTTTVELPVLAYAVNRGDIIGQNDIEWREQEVSRDLVGYVTDELKIIGKEARKHLRSGNPLRSSDLVSPQIIERGQTVDLVARSSGLLVNMQGKALANGAEGDRLIVQNTSSGKRREGLVMASGTVLIQ
jgi:flagella basal body P-ring formation protein FlgA